MGKILKGDFHTHMNGNGIENRRVNVETICQSALEFNFNTVFLGCHDYVAINFKESMEDKYKLKVIPGAEITTTGGHLLALNIEYIPTECQADNEHPLDIYKAIEFIHEQGGKAVIVHPYNPKYGNFLTKVRLENFVALIDGAEVENLRHYLTEGIWNFNWVKQWSHLKFFKGSDAHIWEDHMHRAFYTEVEEEWFNR